MNSPPSCFPASSAETPFRLSSRDLLRKSLQRNPTYGATQLFLAAALSLAGRPDEAARIAETFRAQYPEYPANAFHQLWLARSPSTIYRAQIQPLFEKIRDLGVIT